MDSEHADVVPYRFISDDMSTVGSREASVVEPRMSRTPISWGAATTTAVSSRRSAKGCSSRIASAGC